MRIWPVEAVAPCILIQSEHMQVAKNKKDLSAVDEDKIVSPFRFRLPGLDGSNVTGQNRKAMGHPLAFP